MRADDLAIGQEREEEIRDFSIPALRIARQDGYAVVIQRVNTERKYNGRRQELYDHAMQRLAEYESERGRKATASQVDRIWNEAARDAGTAPEEEDAGDGRRISARSKRH